MKIAIPVRAKLHKGCIMMLADDKKGQALVNKLFTKKEGKEERLGQEYFLTATLELQERAKTFKQLGAVWKLVEVIYESQEGVKPTEDEKYNLYLDLLEEYAERVPSKISPNRTRAVRLSETNTVLAAHFIDGILYHLCTVCDLSLDLQATVSDVLWAWGASRGTEDRDPLDYYDSECSREVTLKEWRERRVYSEATGMGGSIECCHIVARGSSAGDIEAVWNWMALTPEEHREQHQHGWERFLRKYPHLHGKVERARILAGKLIREPDQYKIENLAAMSGKQQEV